MTERTAAEVLSDIVDEVAGYRPTDPRSFLPSPLLRAAREVLGERPTGAGQMLNSADSLAGRTVRQVFDDPKLGDLVFYCEDGCFLVLQADGDEDRAYLREYNGYGHSRKIEDFLRPTDLVELGLMSRDEQQKAEQDAKLAEAKARATRLERLIAENKKELDRLTALANA